MNLVSWRKRKGAVKIGDSLAEACETLNWDDVDRADAETVARAIWSAQKSGVRFPSALYQAPTGGDRDD
ncbi:hypothetical protein [Armatimonas sp.]|uniref:hypothetical protein n=1 Tax=Armatimonas sp. TaxID=1872638 RepID=UPI00286D29C4|nr:hypothetical protein [Armatimonas sp.]